jgi:hypothetical protein
MKDPRYPIGKFEPPITSGPEKRKSAIEVIRSFPLLLQEMIKDISGDDFKSTYRPGSWNVAQLVHHCADANMNCFIRFKLALSEEDPTVKPYKENEWTVQEDYSRELVQASLEITRGVHARWSTLMASMTDSEWKRGFYHPEQKKTVALTEALFYYAWHCRHHLKHIEIALAKVV